LFNLEDDTDVFGGLDEGDEGTMLGGLTHGGRSVMDLPGDDFDAQGFGEDDEDDEERGDKGRVDMRTVRRDHFGGFGQDQEDELVSAVRAGAPTLPLLISLKIILKGTHADGCFQPERKKSKAEVMSEVIAKSKEYKVTAVDAIRRSRRWWRRLRLAFMVSHLPHCIELTSGPV
jgi:nucleolar protein 14